MCVGQRCVEGKRDAEGRREGAQKELQRRKWSKVSCAQQSLDGRRRCDGEDLERGQAFDISGEGFEVRWSEF